MFIFVGTKGVAWQKYKTKGNERGKEGRATETANQSWRVGTKMEKDNYQRYTGKRRRGWSSVSPKIMSSDPSLTKQKCPSIVHFLPTWETPKIRHENFLGCYQVTGEEIWSGACGREDTRGKVEEAPSRACPLCSAPYNSCLLFHSPVYVYLGHSWPEIVFWSPVVEIK